MDGKRVAIVQSSYIPWKGYFDLIRAVDEFITLDDVQFTRRDWRNRNLIKGPAGPQWLTIPVVSKGRYTQTIAETEIAASWAEAHWANLRSNYARAPHFANIAPAIQSLYEEAAGERMLSAVNHLFLRGICRIMAISTPIRPSHAYPHAGIKTERLVSICQAAGARVYLSGPSAASYLDIEHFSAEGIQVVFADYSNYPQYPQRHSPFVHGVTFLDLLFNAGAGATRYMKCLLP